MREHGIFVEKILLDSIGKIKEIEVVDEIASTKKYYTHSEYLKQHIQVENMQILPTSVIIKSEDFCSDLIQVDYENNNKDFDCWIAEIHVENSAINPRILKIGLRAFTNRKKQELIDLGGKQGEGTDKDVFYFSSNQIITMIKNSKSIKRFFYIKGIVLDKPQYNLSFEGNCTQKGVKIVYSNENTEQLNKWIKKATVLNIIHNYSISVTDNRLRKIHSLNDYNLILPPVRTLDTTTFKTDNWSKNLVLQSIRIPDTVRSIIADFFNCKELKSIEFGEETVYIAPYAFGHVTQIEYIDFKNIVTIPIIKDITKLRKIKVRIDAKLPFNFISDLSSLKEIEMKIGQ